MSQPVAAAILNMLNERLKSKAEVSSKAISSLKDGVRDLEYGVLR